MQCVYAGLDACCLNSYQTGWGLLVMREEGPTLNQWALMCPDAAGERSGRSRGCN